MRALIIAAVLMGLAGNACADAARLEAELTEKAKAGDVTAQLDLAFHYWDGHSNDARALAWFEAAAQSGNTEALLELGVIRRHGWMGTTADWNGGMALVLRAAELGNGAAQFDVTHCCYDAPKGYETGVSYDIPPDGTERMRWTISWKDWASSLRHIQGSQAEMKRLIAAGYGAGIDEWHSEFVFNLEDARDGDLNGQSKVADAYLDGLGVAQDKAAAEHWGRIYADSGKFHAQMTLADRYAEGRFGAPDPAMALIYSHRAAAILRPFVERGDKQSQMDLGRLYEADRLGADNTQAQAVGWYRPAAQAGSAPGQAALAHAYFEGRGVPRNVGLGMTWLTRAADNYAAYSEFEFELARIYLAGTIVPRNDYQAYYWYRIGWSNYQGDVSQESFDLEAEYDRVMAELKTRLSATDIAKADAAIATWQMHEREANAGDPLARWIDEP